MKKIIKPFIQKIIYKFLYDYQSIAISTGDVKLAVIHIPDQIGDAMAVFPIIRSLDSSRVEQIVIVASTYNKTVFKHLSLTHARFTIIPMTFQDNASSEEVCRIAKNIRDTYGAPDICIEAMRNKKKKTMLFIKQLRARTNLQIVGLPMKYLAPASTVAARLDQAMRAPVPMTWTFAMKESGFPTVKPAFEFPVSAETLSEVYDEVKHLGKYIALNLEGSIAERTFMLETARNIINITLQHTGLPIMIVHSPKGAEDADNLVASYKSVHHLSLTPSIERSAAVIKHAYMAITPDTAILHMASAFNIPAVAIYSDYKARWSAMQDISETIIVGCNINQINLDEFKDTVGRLNERVRTATPTECNT